MNIQALQHIPDSEYAYALDERTLRLVLRVAKGEKIKSVEVLWNNKYDFPKRRACARMHKYASSRRFDFYVCDLAAPDVRFAYIFLITMRNEAEYYFSEEGLSEEYDFKHGYYTFFQFPFINRADVVKTVPWARDAVVYQIFIDRFKRGDTAKDGSYITQPWEKIPGAKDFAGGDLKGILGELDTIREMGFNTLYLTPVFRSPSNHKYNIANYTKVDPMFGTNEDLYELIRGAHVRGMRVILDTVFNHCDESDPLFSDVKERGKASEYYDWFLVHGEVPERYEDGTCNYEIFADCPYMPKWNTSNPKVREYLINIALTYLSWGVDGLRLDVADEVSHAFWHELRKAAKQSYPEALLLGEVWHENGMYLHGDEFDGVMNYKLQKVFLDYFAEESITAREAAERINGIWMRNRRQHNEMMLNFLDNHDTPRFLRACGEDEERVRAALAALYFCVGIPCVLYGTELLLTGDGDPDCRRTYDWSGARLLGDYLAELAKMRAGLPQGDLYAEDEDGALVLARDDGTERVKAYFDGGAEGIRIKRERI